MTNTTRWIAILSLLASFAQAQSTLVDAPSSTPSYLQAQNTVVSSFLHESDKKTVKGTRGVKQLIALGGALAFAIVADHYDISETEKGIKAGVAVEGNTWFIGTDKPTAGQLYKRDLLVIGVTATPSVLAHIFRAPALFYGGLSMPVVMGMKHISGGNQWKRLLEGQAPTSGELVEPGSN
ncbi:MAG: hypothetical protein ACLQLC_20025 [Candidatus Sulfotelmatobacter sp.]